MFIFSSFNWSWSWENKSLLIVISLMWWFDRFCLFFKPRVLTEKKLHRLFPPFPTEGCDSSDSSWLVKEAPLPLGGFQHLATRERWKRHLKKCNCMFSWRFTKMAGLISQGNLFPPFIECGDCLLPAQRVAVPFPSCQLQECHPLRTNEGLRWKVWDILGTWRGDDKTEQELGLFNLQAAAASTRFPLHAQRKK